VAAPRARAVRRLSHALPLRSTAESCPSTIGLITLDRKQAGERSAGNPHATFDEAGNGNQLTVRLLRHSQRKRRETARHTYGEWRHSSTLLLGEAMETSASFEARSALLPYPTTREECALSSTLSGGLESLGRSNEERYIQKRG
jgi:hypothetical protein